jgi:hypothetical protein
MVSFQTHILLELLMNCNFLLYSYYKRSDILSQPLCFSWFIATITCPIGACRRWAISSASKFLLNSSLTWRKNDDIGSLGSLYTYITLAPQHKLTCLVKLTWLRSLESNQASRINSPLPTPCLLDRN